MKTFGRLFGAALVVLAALVFLVLALGPRSGRYQTVTVLTGSMRPSMPEGSVLVATPVPLDRLGVGDVVTYRIPVEDRRVVTHRIVEIVRGGDRPVVVTKGDANAAPDPWVAELKGGHAWKVTAVVPKAGYALHALRMPLVTRLVLPVVCALLALLWLRDIWREDDQAPAPAIAAAAVASTSAVRSTVALVALLSLGAARGRTA